jgi:hypothetical protein
MLGADIFEANKDELGWVVNVRTGEGYSLPPLKEGDTIGVKDVKDASAACQTTSGVEFTSTSNIIGQVNIITAWSSDGTFSLGYHGRENRNVSCKTKTL